MGVEFPRSFTEEAWRLLKTLKRARKDCLKKTGILQSKKCKLPAYILLILRMSKNKCKMKAGHGVEEGSQERAWLFPPPPPPPELKAAPVCEGSLAKVRLFVLFDLIFLEIDSKEIISLKVKVRSGRDTTFTAITGGKRPAVLLFCHQGAISLTS